MKKKTTISERAIRAMPYETRLRFYEREKDELFLRISNMSTAEIAKAHSDLARKWMV
jgi:hypothetical protein